MRVCIRQWALQSFSSEDHHETMSFPWFDNDLGVADFPDLPRKEIAKLLAHLRVNTASPPVGHDAFAIERAEVCSRGDIARLQVDPKAQSFDDPSPHFEFERIVPKQAKMTGTASRSDAGCHGDHPPLRRVLREF